MSSEDPPAITPWVARFGAASWRLHSMVRHVCVHMAGRAVAHLDARPEGRCSDPPEVYVVNTRDRDAVPRRDAVTRDTRMHAQDVETKEGGGAIFAVYDGDEFLACVFVGGAERNATTKETSVGRQWVAPDVCSLSTCLRARNPHERTGWVQCAACKKARYCSRAHLLAHSDDHSIMCVSSTGSTGAAGGSGADGKDDGEGDDDDADASDDADAEATVPDVMLPKDMREQVASSTSTLLTNLRGAAMLIAHHADRDAEAGKVHKACQECIAACETYLNASNPSLEMVMAIHTTHQQVQAHADQMKEMIGVSGCSLEEARERSVSIITQIRDVALDLKEKEGADHAIVLGELAEKVSQVLAAIEQRENDGMPPMVPALYLEVIRHPGLAIVHRYREDELDDSLATLRRT